MSPPKGRRRGAIRLWQAYGNGQLTVSRTHTLSESKNAKPFFALLLQRLGGRRKESINLTIHRNAAAKLNNICLYFFRLLAYYFAIENVRCAKHIVNEIHFAICSHNFIEWDFGGIKTQESTRGILFEQNYFI